MQSHPYVFVDQSDLPPELCLKPLALVGISGLDTLNNAVHKSIWETFNGNRRIERSPVLFRLISNSHEFPIVKPKRNSYEWYIPKGILKKNWMNKHLNEIPAVMAVFYDLDWKDLQWNEKMIECASRVQSIKAALESRNTKIVVVLIQDCPPLPSGEDILATERAVALCASCELNAKSLFVLPHDDHLQGYVVRLENAFYESAKNYYYLEAKNIKSHREHLNKTTHQYLFVRHQFKMGFLNELRQDNHTAHKHYTHAYNNLLEIRIVDTNAMEIRTVAGFINYKLCRLMFSLGLPRDAISQFRSHTDRFKTRIGFQELTFEHYGWLSKQFSVFGDVFDEAVKLGLPAVQTQHPGLYYQQAAQYAILRKNSCQEICRTEKYPIPDPLENSKHLEFYGQRPWRPGKLTAEPPDPHLEMKGIEALQFLEKQVNHSNIIISLFGYAISQYKTYRCLRMRRHLVVQMAEEYFNSGDYGKALTLFTHMLWDYRTECWWHLLTDILCKATDCAFLTGSVQDYILLSLELLGTSTTISTEKRMQIYENLNRVLNRCIPEHKVDTPPNTITHAQALWKQFYAANTSKLSVDMTNILCCFEVKARFMQKQYQGDQSVFVEIFIRSSCPYELQFFNVSTAINTPEYTSEYTIENLSEEEDLLFKYNYVKRYLVEFMPDPNDVEKEIQIAAVNVVMGTKNNSWVDLKFTGFALDSSKLCVDLTHFRRNIRTIYEFENMKPLPTALIIPRCSKIHVKIDHHQPALLGEWYEIDISIVNEEKFMIENVQLEITLNGDSSNQTEFYVDNQDTPENLPMQLKLNNLNSSAFISKKVLMCSHNVGPRNVCIKLTYLLKSKKPVLSVKEDSLDILVVKPFEVTTKFFSSSFGEILKFYVEEPFIVMPVVNCLSPWPILLESTGLDLCPLVKLLDTNTKSQIEGLILRNGDSGADVYYAKVSKPAENAINVGQFNITWKRPDGKSTTTCIPINGLTADWIPIDLELPLPAYGLVRTPLLVSYRFFNRSHHLIQLEMNMEASEAFMFAGYKQSQITILPGTTKMLQYNLYPLVAGSVLLPKLSLSICGENDENSALKQDELDSLVERSLPTHLFIMPQGKGLGTLKNKTESE